MLPFLLSELQTYRLTGKLSTAHNYFELILVFEKLFDEVLTLVLESIFFTNLKMNLLMMKMMKMMAVSFEVLIHSFELFDFLVVIGF